MDRVLLKGYLDDGLSLVEIGALQNRDPSTVGYWVAKHGLTANGRDKYAPRGGLTREELEPLVESGATLQEIAAAIDRSASTARHWLNKHGLRTKNRRGPRPRFDRPDLEAIVASGARTVKARCHVHGETNFAVVGARQRLHCKRCRSIAVAKRRRKVKELVVEEAGGRCAACGYDRCLAALEFHHKDPTTKAFGLAERGVTRSIEAVRAEARKCVLLCSNCHAEVEAGFAVL